MVAFAAVLSAGVSTSSSFSKWSLELNFESQRFYGTSVGFTKMFGSPEKDSSFTLRSLSYLVTRYL